MEEPLIHSIVQLQTLENSLLIRFRRLLTTKTSMSTSCLGIKKNKIGTE
ncbi:hypothetical protein AHF37_11339 [Paragonimus kellicotti]|nr:hypothetical protein AHF37_11339 [Paragonimus kellicotti]